MIFIGFRDTDLKKKKKKNTIEEEPKNPQISSFPHHVGGFELTIEANEDRAEEEEAVEDEDKEEAAELDSDDCAGGFTGFVEGSGRICGLKGKNKVKCPLSPNMLHWQANRGLILCSSMGPTKK